MTQTLGRTQLRAWEPDANSDAENAAKRSNESIDLALGSLMLAGARRIAAAGEGQFLGLAIKPQVSAVIYLIGREPGLRQTNIALQLGMDASTLGRYIDRLESQGLVIRQSVPEDRRAWSLRLSAEGYKTFGQIDLVMREIDRKVADRMGSRKYERLSVLLSEFMKATDGL